MASNGSDFSSALGQLKRRTKKRVRNSVEGRELPIDLAIEATDRLAQLSLGAAPRLVAFDFLGR
jgi:hypothetical protein